MRRTIWSSLLLTCVLCAACSQPTTKPEADATPPSYRTAAQESGELVWASSFDETNSSGDPIYAAIADVQVDSDGSVFVLGVEQSYSPFSIDFGMVDDATILKFDSDGAKAEATFSIEASEALLVDSEGDLYAVGWSEGREVDDPNELLIYKIAAERDRAWCRTIEMPDGKGFLSGASTVVRAAIDADDNIYVVAEVAARLSPSAGRGAKWRRSIVFTKLDSEAEALWQVELASEEDDYCFDIAISEDGELYLVGMTEGELFGENAGGRDTFIAKYDSEGAALWGKQMGTSGDDKLESVCVGDDGRIYTAGSTNGTMGDAPIGGRDVLLMAFDAAGGVTWTRQFGTIDNDRALAIAFAPSGGIYVGGHTRGAMRGSITGSVDIFLGKYDAQGQELWVEQVGCRGRTDLLSGMVAKENFLYVIGKAGGDLLDGALPRGPFLMKYQTRVGDASDPGE